MAHSSLYDLINGINSKEKFMTYSPITVWMTVTTVASLWSCRNILFARWLYCHLCCSFCKCAIFSERWMVALNILSVLPPFPRILFHEYSTVAMILQHMTNAIPMDRFFCCKLLYYKAFCLAEILCQILLESLPGLSACWPAKLVSMWVHMIQNLLQRSSPFCGRHWCEAQAQEVPL